MVAHGLAPLFIDGPPPNSSLGFQQHHQAVVWLNDLYDKQINWDNPRRGDFERDQEFNAPPFVASGFGSGEQWQVVDTEPR
jgi:hypothetical protein